MKTFKVLLDDLWVLVVAVIVFWPWMLGAWDIAAYALHLPQSAIAWGKDYWIILWPAVAFGLFVLFGS